MGPFRYFFSYHIVNVWSSLKCRSSAGVAVPELHRRRFLVRQRHRMDGRCALHHLPGGPGRQERRSVLCPQRAVHHPPGNRRVHGNQDPGFQREDPGANSARVRSDCPLNVFQAANTEIKTKTIINQGIFVFFSGGGGGTIVIASTILFISTS